MVKCGDTEESRRGDAWGGMGFYFVLPCFMTAGLSGCWCRRASTWKRPWLNSCQQSLVLTHTMTGATTVTHWLCAAFLRRLWSGLHTGPFIMSARPHGSLHGHKSTLSVPGCCMKGQTRDRDVVKVLLRLSQCKFNIIHSECRGKRAFMREQSTLAACDGAINAAHKH